MKNKTSIALLLFITCFFNPAYANESDIRIEDPWIAEAPPVSKVMVAYMTIDNTGPEAIDIVRAESDLYSSIEFHETRYEDGMAMMIHHDSLSIPATGRLVLKRGGPHLMLFNPIKKLSAGDTVNMALITKSGETINVAVPVKKAQF